MTVPRIRAPGWVRLVLSSLVVIGVCVGLGHWEVQMLPSSWGGPVLSTGAAVYRRVSLGPLGMRAGLGWPMVPSGDYRWWDGSKWTEHSFRRDAVRRRIGVSLGRVRT